MIKAKTHKSPGSITEQLVLKLFSLLGCTEYQSVDWTLQKLSAPWSPPALAWKHPCCRVELVYWRCLTRKVFEIGTDL